MAEQMTTWSLLRWKLTCLGLNVVESFLVCREEDVQFVNQPQHFAGVLFDSDCLA